MIKYVLGIFLSLIINVANTYAGWYECYNFKGTIDKYPITLSIQVRAEYFGEKEKADFNILGVYKYDNRNTPIRLEGNLNFKNNKIFLYEMSKGLKTAIFEFDFSEAACNGTWKNLSTNKVMSLQLDYVSKLVDTSANSTFTDIEILQANSLADFYFIGVYSKIAGRNRAEMTRLKIITKKDQSVFQTIDFSKIKTQTGNSMTLISENLQVVDIGKKELSVSNDIGGMGGYLEIFYNAKTKKFWLNPHPKMDGPD